MRKNAGQAMPEFALMIPIMTLLIFGLVFAGFYAFRATAADWGVFITGVAEGSYNTPATSIARGTILWPDIQEAVATSQDAPRRVRSMITMEKTTPWAFGINLIEAQKGQSVFRLWRFYPGPPPPGGFE
ncbi:MAG: pilus assembly protein [Anaerolineales bacterium]|uniref:Pilus assembly protein n=1 Tax=Candidatus Desulfolinea nitratireducens TaxID=2841698 RepID=A0A8J6NS97_9CHLR|nr:pilus assembly protein [Candidatus Desulfolinea nitratireducens]